MFYFCKTLQVMKFVKNKLYLIRVSVNITSFKDLLHKYTTDSWVQRAGGQTWTSWGEWQIHDSLELCLTMLMLPVSVWRWRRSLSTSSSRAGISHRAMQAPKCPLELCLDKENSFRGWTDFLLALCLWFLMGAVCVYTCVFVRLSGALYNVDRLRMK